MSGARPSVTPLERPVDGDWLALREPADARARDAVADELLPALRAHLSRRGGELHVVDVGAGTGAGARWLAGQLPAARWTLLDHDADLLARAAAGLGPTGREAQQRLGDLDDAAALVRGGGVDVLTATALLDLLRPAETDVLVGAALSAAVPLLLSLTVTGEVTLDPPHPADADLAAAFDAHQRRGGRLGPDAAAPVVERLRGAGWRVLTAASPWRLGAAGAGEDDGPMLRAWLDGRAEAAVEQEPALAGRAASWLSGRRRQVDEKRLGVLVGHVEVLALPGQERDG
ncbi:class I SAM-dependent methyltransferase [Pseudokineococcus sp. 1T1Z-3]|uniref:class I SAM-dependent methyltransferase n=1 Tax=Pseudokineococcus sp. 1T1Z-3 TaxID=3132745 RepID=UPI0030A36D63